MFSRSLTRRAIPDAGPDIAVCQLTLPCIRCGAPALVTMAVLDGRRVQELATRCPVCG